jgi:M3 family oligoendopeptidase
MEDKVFSQFIYERPDEETLLEAGRCVTERLRQAGSAAEAEGILRDMNRLRESYQTFAVLAEIRYTMDTGDLFYREEQQFFDRFNPLWEEVVNDFDRAVSQLPFREELIPVMGELFFTLADFSSQIDVETIKDELIVENRLSSRYTLLLASALLPDPGQIGSTITLAEAARRGYSPDRKARHLYAGLRNDFFNSKQAELDSLFDDLTACRHTIARKQGFPSFTAIGYNRMQRTSYGREETAGFRDSVHQFIVPLVSRLREQQRRRLKLDRLCLYDEDIPFPGAFSAVPGGSRELVDGFGRIFGSLSAETDEFYHSLTEHQMMDTELRKGKISGAYSNFLPEWKLPFVFLSYNNNNRAVRTFAHECGHAFQYWLCRDEDIPSHREGSSDIAEIHSLSMEYLLWPYMDELLADSAADYRFEHLLSALSFLPYGAAVDEFQHQIYDHPHISAVERRRLWSDLEQKYLPFRQYDGMDFYDSGGFWQTQTHIFKWPFYYIDYALAQVCALQFFEKAEEDHASSWKQYMKLCRMGGRFSFNTVLSRCGLKSPFEADTIKNITSSAEAWLDNYERRDQNDKA